MRDAVVQDVRSSDKEFFVDLGPKQRSPTQVLFSLPFVVWIGLISYSIYLWHRFVFEIFKHAFTIETVQQKAEFAPVMLGITIAVSAASYYGIEQRFLRLKNRFEERCQKPTAHPVCEATILRSRQPRTARSAFLLLSLEAGNKIGADRNEIVGTDRRHLHVTAL